MWWKQFSFFFFFIGFFLSIPTSVYLLINKKDYYKHNILDIYAYYLVLQLFFIIRIYTFPFPIYSSYFYLSLSFSNPIFLPWRSSSWKVWTLTARPSHEPCHISFITTRDYIIVWKLRHCPSIPWACLVLWNSTGVAFSSEGHFLCNSLHRQAVFSW